MHSAVQYDKGKYFKSLLPEIFKQYTYKHTNSETHNIQTPWKKDEKKKTLWIYAIFSNRNLYIGLAYECEMYFRRFLKRL